MAWKISENSNTEKPEIVDSTSSNSVVYIRRNFKLIEENEDRPAHYEYEEMVIPKDVYDIISEHNLELSDIESALIELAEMIIK